MHNVQGKENTHTHTQQLKVTLIECRFLFLPLFLSRFLQQTAAEMKWEKKRRYRRRDGWDGMDGWIDGCNAIFREKEGEERVVLNDINDLLWRAINNCCCSKLDLNFQSHFVTQLLYTSSFLPYPFFALAGAGMSIKRRIALLLFPP